MNPPQQLQQQQQKYKKIYKVTYTNPLTVQNLISRSLSNRFLKVTRYIMYKVHIVQGTYYVHYGHKVHKLWYVGDQSLINDKHSESLSMFIYLVFQMLKIKRIV